MSRSEPLVEAIAGCILRHQIAGCILRHQLGTSSPAKPSRWMTDAAREIAVKAGDLLEVDELEYLAKWLGNEEL